jgi:uncharacterized protein YndB with AHSA1/START domain
MQTSTALVARDAETCWRTFIDPTLLTSWVPGLRRAQVIAKEHGLPSEIHFEFSSSLAYTLVYRYDRERLEVQWTPKLGKRDGVAGSVRFEREGDRTRVTYTIQHGDARSDAERALDDPEKLLAAFATHVQRVR